MEPDLADVVVAAKTPDVVVGLLELEVPEDPAGAVVACAAPPQLVAVEPATALENAASIHDFAELAAANDGEGAMEIRAAAKSVVSVCSELRSLEAISPRPAFSKAACWPTKALTELMISGIKELIASRIEVVSESERGSDVPFASVIPCLMASPRLLSACVTGTADATSPL